MADKSLKASIQVDMDAKGVAKGVAATNRELDKLNRTARSTARSAGITAGLNAAQAAYGIISTVLRSITEHVNKLDELGRTFSREGATAEGMRQAAQMQSDVAIGQAVGPASAMSAMVEEKKLRDRAARIQADAANMAGGMAAWESLTGTLGSVLTAAKDQFVSNFSDPLAVDQPSILGAVGRAAGTFDFYRGAEMAAGVGSARGMPYDPQMERQNRLLESIDRKQGGQ